jgi:hypothetical protein
MKNATLGNVTIAEPILVTIEQADPPNSSLQGA